MATTYLTPGVYVEEVDKGSKPIEGVGTATAAFVGFAERGPINQPTFVTSWTQFVSTFGAFIPGGYLAHAVYGFFNNGGATAYITRIPLDEADAASARGTKALPAAVLELPARAGAGAVSLDVTAREGGSAGSDITIEVQPATAPEGKTAADDEFTLVVKKGDTEERFENVSFKKDRKSRNVVDTVNSDSKLVQLAERESTASTVERMPTPGTYPLALPAEAAAPAAKTTRLSTGILIGDAAERSGVNGLEVAEDATMVLFPDLMALYQAGRIDMEGVQAVQQAMLDHAQNMADRVAILDAPPDMNPQAIRDWRMKEVNYDSKYGALYYPWIKVANPIGDGSIYVPPSGHMAGIWARNDSQRGVHKAPANEVVAGAIGLQYQTTHNEQSILNPVGINVIRSFPGRGIRVWGARTLSSDPSWRYLNVRRLFNYISESLLLGTQWAVFEPNDRSLWEKLKRDVRAFLVRVYMDGALFGATPAEAFYVKCDDENNPLETRDVGQVIVEVGIAPVKPAEFVIIRLSQWQEGGTAG
jgi:phage tail sheath protein FI